MSRYRKTSSVPLIAAVVLLAAFVGLVVWFAGADEKEGAQATAPPVVREDPAPAVAPEPEEALRAEPRARMTAGEADRLLRAATAEWRAFAVELCREQGWSEDKAVAFLEETTWNDRDKEKQHANGLQSLARMAGVKAEDPVALAEALARQVRLEEFFARNWEKLQWEWKPAPEATVLEDAWKETRIRWGFPLDTPVDDLQEFKLAGLTTALQAWQTLAATALQGEGGGHETGMESKWGLVIGRGARAQEAKMHAALRVLLEMPDSSVKDVVAELVRRVGAQEQEEFAKAVLSKMDAALKAAEQAQ